MGNAEIAGAVFVGRACRVEHVSVGDAALNALLTVAGFAAILAVLIFTSAVVTATIHKALASAGVVAIRR
jgi:hypothetical protein